jgi:hypothetical protein
MVVQEPFATVRHVESTSQAWIWLQQLCLRHVVHAVSPALAAHVEEPASALEHAVWQLLSAHDTRSAKAVSCPRHELHVPSAEQLSSHETHVESSLHAVACGQHCCARHAAHAPVPVTAGHEELPPPDPELAQPLDDPPMPPPPMPLGAPQELLFPEEQPATATRIANARGAASLARRGTTTERMLALAYHEARRAGSRAPRTVSPLFEGERVRYGPIDSTRLHSAPGTP